MRYAVLKKLFCAFLLLCAPFASAQILCPSGYSFNGICWNNPQGNAIMGGQSGTGTAGKGGSITIVPGAPTGASTAVGDFVIQLDPTNPAVNFTCSNPIQGGVGTAACTFNGTTVTGAVSRAYVISLWTGTCSAITFLSGGGSCTSPLGTTVAGGTADDTAAVQAVINALPSTNGQIRFQPNVIYSIGAAGIHFTNFTNLDVDFNGAQFQALTNSTQTDNVGSFVYVLFTNCTNCKIHGGNFNGQTFKGGFLDFVSCTDDEIYGNYSTNTGAGTSWQFGSNGSTRLRWHDNVAVSGGGSSRGFWLGNSNAGLNDIDEIIGPNNKAISNAATGFALESAGAQIFGNYALNNGGAGFISSTATGSQSVDHNFIANTAIGNGFHGYQTDVFNSVPVLRVSLVGNRFENNVQSCMYLGSAQFFSITGNLCITNNSGGANNQITIFGTSNNINITGNTILTTALANDAGIQLSGAATYTMTDITIDGNNITCGGTAQGLGIQAILGNSTAVRRLVISSNVLSTCAGGIRLQPTVAGDVMDDVAVVGNTINNMGGVGYLKFQGFSANQITKARAIGNSGGLTIDANTTLIENFGNTWNVALTAPTISSGFGTSPSITQNNGYRSFSVNVGTGGVATSGVVGLPTAAHGWACAAADVTTPTGDLTQQTASSTTTATFTNYVRTTGIAGAWPASDILQIQCNPN